MLVFRSETGRIGDAVDFPDSDTIIEFEFDSVTGWMTPTLRIIETGSPVCITFR